MKAQEEETWYLQRCNRATMTCMCRHWTFPPRGQWAPLSCARPLRPFTPDVFYPGVPTGLSTLSDSVRISKPFEGGWVSSRWLSLLTVVPALGGSQALSLWQWFWKLHFSLEGQLEDQECDREQQINPSLCQGLSFFLSGHRTAE